MSNPVAPAVAAPTIDVRRTKLVRAQISLYVLAAAAVGLAAMILVPTSSSDNTGFHYVGDYLLTALGFPFLLPLVVLLPTLRTLQRQRDGALGRAGIIAASAGALVLVGLLGYDLIIAASSSLGPTYVIASVVAIVGVVLFAVGSWGAGLLPRWLLVAWPVTFTIGGTLPIFPPGVLLLAAVYLAMAVTLPRRVVAH